MRNEFADDIPTKVEPYESIDDTDRIWREARNTRDDLVEPRAITRPLGSRASRVTLKLL